MKRLALIGVLAVLLLCSACGKQAETSELTRVVFARGHGSTWGNQFRMEVCPTEISYAHFFVETAEGKELKELYAVPIEKAQWEQLQTAALPVLDQLEIQKEPGPVKRLLQYFEPKTVDGGEWKKLTATWLIGDEPQEVKYIWTATAEADALELLLEELAGTLEK